MQSFPHTYIYKSVIYVFYYVEPRQQNPVLYIFGCIY